MPRAPPQGGDPLRAPGKIIWTEIDEAPAGAQGRTHVVTAKAGLAGMTRALALDLAPHGITVNCVVPGTIETVRGLGYRVGRSRHGKKGHTTGLSALE